MTTYSVSVGQAACNAAASWIRSHVTPDVTVYSAWPVVGGPKLGPRVISVIPVGRRERVDVTGISVSSERIIGAGSTRFVYEIGHVTQPCQIDMWDTVHVGRDDLIAQLDSILNMGDAATGSSSVSPDNVSDGMAIPFLPEDGFAGTVEAWLDEPEFNDAPDSIQRSEYRATILGELRCALVVTRTSPRMSKITLTTTTK